MLSMEAINDTASEPILLLESRNESSSFSLGFSVSQISVPILVAVFGDDGFGTSSWLGVFEAVESLGLQLAKETGGSAIFYRMLSEAILVS